MTAFQSIALLLIIIWLLLVALRFRRSAAILIGGLAVIGAFTLVAALLGRVRPADLGLGAPASWLRTFAWSLGGLIVMLAYSPLADRLAGRFFKEPPTLDAFTAVQHSRLNLIAGIAAAWLLGGFLEELVARGIALKALVVFLAPWLSGWLAAGSAVCIAAIGAGLMHSYQGPRAMLIITQLSILFGVLFVLSGYNLWAVMLCHGLYDTIAFVRFANKKSRFARPQ